MAVLAETARGLRTALCLGVQGTDTAEMLVFARHAEKLAPAAEQAYWQHSRRQTNDAAAAVRVLNGAGVIENVYVGGEPIAQFVTHAAQEK